MNQKITIDAILQYLFVVYAFILPLTRAGVGIMSALIVILFFFHKDFKSLAVQILKNRASQAILFFLLFYLLAALRAPTEKLYEALHYSILYLYLLPSVVGFVVLKQNTILQIIVAFLLGIFTSVIITYGIYFEWWHKNRITPIDPTPFMHSIQYSTLIAFGVIISLYRVLHQKNWNHKLLYIAFIVISLGALFLLKGRTGQIAFLVSLFVVVMMEFEHKIRALCVTLFATAALLFGAYHLSSTFQERITMAQSDIDNMLMHNNYATSLGYRVGAIKLSADLIQENPLLGTGIIDAILEVQKRAKVEFPNDYFLQRANHMQNQYLQIIVESGFVGLFVFAYMLYQIARIPLKSNEYQSMKITLMVIFLLTMISDVQMHVQFTSGFFGLIVALLLATSRIEQEGLYVKSN